MLQPTALKLNSANILWTNATLGNLGHNPPRTDHDDFCCGEDVVHARAGIRPGTWIYVTQVHGGDVAIADEMTFAGEYEADAIVTVMPEATLSISTADCAPIALSSKEGVVAAVHGSWRSLQAGILCQTAAIMRRSGATDISAALGPCIHSECYEFDENELRPMTSLWGAAVRGITNEGTASLDLPEVVRAACKASDIELVSVDSTCTGCDERYFSHRKRRDVGRQVMLVSVAPDVN